MNRYEPHIVILPEDSANRQIANGFVTNLNVNSRTITILGVANGWPKVGKKFEESLIPEMHKYPEMLVILLIDLDKKTGKMDHFDGIKKKIPNELENRVFILSTLSKPEDLKKDLGNFEAIGDKLANDCQDNTDATWQHPLLSHNQNELQRIATVKQIIFG